MNAMTNAERTRKHRAIKAAQEFAKKHGLGTCPTVEEFIEAKAQDDAPGPHYSLTVDKVFISRFNQELSEYDHEWASEYLDADELPDGEDYPAYSIHDMLEAWKTAEDVYGND